MACEGRYDKTHIPITRDVCDVAERLKEIDSTYFVMLNRKSGLFEVHSSGQSGDTLCVTVPFDELDDRCIELVRKTAMARASLLLDEMDRINNQLRIKQARDAAEKVISASELCKGGGT